jgi:hypothetical protein
MRTHGAETFCPKTHCLMQDERQVPGDAWFRTEGCERGLTERRTYEMLMTTLHTKLSDAEIELLSTEGAHFSEEQALLSALSP